MMSIATAKKAERLIQERSRIAGAKLTANQGQDQGAYIRPSGSAD
jgi:hypothetical protein